MKSKTLLITAVAAILITWAPEGHSQLFNSGSDGSLGPLVVSSSDVTLTVPTDGVFNFTTITINAGHTLRFNRNALNTPVYLLATGDIVISGSIDVSGSQSPSIEPGLGGPGGFDGGRIGGDGKGPGGGRRGTDDQYRPDFAGGGGYATVQNIATTNKGATYGSPLVIPLVGGSGGGGTTLTGGGGGGGAILLASNTRIQISGSISARGGFYYYSPNGGSGGAIRLVSPSVSGVGALDAAADAGGFGRVRIDLIDRTGFNPAVSAGSYTVGSFMTVFPPGGNPRLDIIQAANTTIPEGTNSPVVITLPFGSDTNRTVTVQARNFGVVVPIEVALIPQLGSSVRYQTNIDNSTLNPASVIVPVAIPVNTPTAIQAWTRP